MKEHKDCIFCKIATKQIETDFHEETENFMVFDDINPVSDGHCLIVTKKHFDNILEMPSLMGSELVTLIKSQSLRLKKEGKADGIKTVQNNGKAAGQIVFHFHMHIIPEKESFKRERTV